MEPYHGPAPQQTSHLCANSKECCVKKASARSLIQPDGFDPEIKPFSLLNGTDARTNVITEIQAHFSFATDLSDLYPCTPFQESMMALAMKQKGMFVPQKIYKLPADLDLERFRSAWKTTVGLNAPLRSRVIQTRLFGLVQVVLKEEPIEWMTAASLEEYCGNDRERPFTFGSPLFRYCIISDLESGQKHFVWTAHHVMIDGWSMRLLLKQVDQAYQGCRMNGLVEFNRFVSYLTALDQEVVGNYWRQQLAGFAAGKFPSKTHLPATYLPAADATLKLHINVPENLKSVATTSSIIQAAWALLIGRYTYSNDIVFGLVQAGRNLAITNINSINGPLVATVPMRIVIDNQSSVSEFLGAIRRDKSAMKPYQHAGLQNIRRLSDDACAACDFQNMLVVQPAGEKDPHSLFGVPHFRRDHWEKLAACPLLLQCDLSADGFTAMATFDKQVIPERQVKMILQQLEYVITQLSSGKVGCIGEIDICVRAREREIRIWNTNVEEVQSCVHNLIERRSRVRPKAPAIHSWDGRLTYDQLEAMSTRLAHRLKNSKVGPEVMVALLFEHSLWMVVAIIATMKAGGVFVPLDPAHPKQRIDKIIRDVGGKLLLCSEKYFDKYIGSSDENIMVNEAEVQGLPLLETPICQVVKPENAIYVIYTSGSTGKPKGCVLEHKACSSSIIQLAKIFTINSRSRVLQFSSYAFDSCILEILATLTVGGCICIPSDQERLHNITASINTMNVNSAFLTPSFARLIRPEAVPGLRVLALGGEKLAQSDIDRWFGRLRLFNVYGPSECCIVCVVNEITHKDTRGSQIGSGIIGTFLVVGDANQIHPVGTIGELLIGGPNLGRGYLNDPKKTATAFLENPAWIPRLETSCNRFYRTGDLVKANSDGTIEYHGRKDTQAKLNGQRIEMGEVEHHLRANLNDAVSLAAEIITPAKNAQKSLLAAFISMEPCNISDEDMEREGWIENQPFPAKTVAELSEALRILLPLYMVPSFFIPLKKIPLGTTGKTDRSKLQKLAEDLTIDQLIAYGVITEKSSAPMTEKEEVMQRLWADVLGIQRDIIGTNNSFLALGGDSIHAMKLVAVAHEEHLLLTVTDVFSSPKLSDLALKAANIEDVNGSSSCHTLAPFELIGGPVRARYLYGDVMLRCNISEELIEDLYPCTPFQKGVMALSIRNLGAYMAQHVFELSNSIKNDLTRFRAAWEAVVELNSILRSRIIQTDSSEMIQAVINEGITWTSANDLERYLSDDRVNHMGLGTRLFRYAIIVTANECLEKSYFVWTTHHAMYDGWSLSRILEYLAHEYERLETKEENRNGWIRRTKDQPIAFNRFIEHLQGLDSHAGEPFWRAQLCGGEPSTFPPFQRAYTSRPSASFVYDFAFTPSMSSIVTPSAIIRAAWAILIARYANCSDVIFGATLSGRTGSLANLDRINGPTITTVPVRICTDPSMAVTDFVYGVQKQALDMIPFEHMGLSDISRIDARARLACQFQNLLIIQSSTHSNIDASFLGNRQQCHVEKNNFDTYALTLECSLDDNRLKAASYFDPQVISEAQLKRMMFQFEHILQQLVRGDKSDMTLGEIETISPQDLQQLWEWNAIVPPMMESCIHHLIEKIAYEEPSSQAICSWDGELSYGELDSLASRLANRLIAEGVTLETKVPILFNKSVWAVVAILGIVKAGGAFVPLDPSHPKARLRSCLRQLEAKTLLCSTELADMCLGSFPEFNSIPINEFEMTLPLPNDSRILPANVRPCNALYVIFTSGTTGTPKGTVVEHGAYCSSARDHSRALFFDRSSRHLQFASYSFDISIEDILTILMVGGVICIPSEAERKYDLAGALERMKVTSADLTPSYLHTIAPEDVKSLRQIILGGEPLTSKIIRTWADKVRLINAYGTSETSVTNIINSNIAYDTDPADVGFPVGAVCWIVDAANSDKLAPIGTIGELLIEGPTLAREYLHDAKKTEAAFIQNPLWACERDGKRRPQRLYKTGDLARYNPDGSIYYIGRKDTQTKIRGQRIELNEVEHHLISHPQIQSAIAVIPEMGPFQDSLVALIQPYHMKASSKHDDIGVIVAQDLEHLGLQLSNISSYLADILPAHMVPTRWIAVERLPLQSSNKVDRAKAKSWLTKLPEKHWVVTEVRAEEATPLFAHEAVAYEISIKIADLVASNSPTMHAAISGHDVKLTAVGVDSIQISSLAAFIKRSYGVTVGIHKLLGSHTSVRDISNHILEAKVGLEHESISSQIDLMKEFSILSAHLESSERAKSPLKTVFLTGGTGFLGTQILRQLLDRSDVARIITHVRAPTVKQGRDRIIASAKLARWWSEQMLSRLEIWIGDLAQPKLGLNPEQWKKLSKVSAIIHNGASVQWHVDYHILKPANVISTLDLLSLTTKNGPKPSFIYVSGGRDYGEEIPVSEIAARLAPLDGYSQTKFMSELLVKHSAYDTPGGDPRRIVSIVKPGLIIGTTEEGVANVNDLLWRYVSSAVRLKAYPQPAADDWLAVSSAEKAAAAVIETLSSISSPSPIIPSINTKPSKRNEAASMVRTNSITDGILCSTFWEIVSTRFKHTLMPVPGAKWMDLLEEDIEKTREKHPLWPVVHLLPRDGRLGGKMQGNVSDGAGGVVAAVKKNLEFLIEIGYLAGPEGEGEGAVAYGEWKGFTRSK